MEQPVNTGVGPNSGQCPVTGLGAEFNPFVDPYLADPYTFFARARHEEPIFYSPLIDHWVVARYEEVRRVVTDPETFSSRNVQLPVTPWPPEAAALFQAAGLVVRPSISSTDRPMHTRWRTFLADAFTPKRVAWLEAHARRLVTEAIEGFADRGRVDLVKEMFYEVPARVLFVFLGIPDLDVPKVKQWSGGRALLTWGRLSAQEILDQLPSFIEYRKYCAELVDRLEQEPGEDYTSELIKKLETGHPEELTKEHVAMTLFSLLMAGHETTTNQAGNGVRALLQHRAAWEELCQDPGLIPNAVEEILRYESSVIAWRRITTREVEIGGVRIPRDAQLLLLLGAANRDEAQFEDGERFDIHRKNANRHLSFSQGIHYCIGAPLARLELKVVLEELTRRLPSLRLVEGQTYRYSPNTSHRGPTSLWVEWSI
jgi:cytochrome P450